MLEPDDFSIRSSALIPQSLPPIPMADRDHILRHTAEIWPLLRGARLFVTGGTGFFGKWLLEAIAAANDVLDAQVCATLLSRDPGRFSAETPHLAKRQEFSWLAGDIADFSPPSGHFDYAFHLATASAAEVAAGGTATIMHNLHGTQRVLDFARVTGVNRLLYASSGAIYGQQPTELSHIPEHFRGAPDPLDPASGYGEMKRMEEHMCLLSGVDCVIARGFSFIGPYLPLSDKFAAGSFLHNAAGGRTIRIKGDGSPIRSYLYAADLAIWLITLIVRGPPSQEYNVGSDRPVSIRHLADLLAQLTGTTVSQASLRTDAKMPNKYIPDIAKARGLGLSTDVPLDIALSRTVNWASEIVPGKRFASDANTA